MQLEAVVTILVTNDSGLDQGSGSRGGKKWWGSRWNLKVEPIRAATGLEIGCKKRKERLQTFGFTNCEG